MEDVSNRSLAAPFLVHSDKVPPVPLGKEVLGGDEPRTGACQTSAAQASTLQLQVCVVGSLESRWLFLLCPDLVLKVFLI